MVVSVAKWTAFTISPTSLLTAGAPVCVISRSAWLPWSQRQEVASALRDHREEVDVCRKWTVKRIRSFTSIRGLSRTRVSHEAGGEPGVASTVLLV